MNAYLVRKSNGDVELFAVEENETMRVLCDQEIARFTRKTSENTRKEISEAIANGFNLVDIEEFKTEMANLDKRMCMPSGL